MPEAVLAIDQGTTGSTARVLGHDGRVLGRAYRELEQHFPRPGWVEHDAEEIWRISLGVMADALAKAGLADGQLRAIGITNQRETTVVWERDTGRPVHRAIVWQSRQTAELCETLRRGGHEPRVREKTGLVIDAYFSATKIRWILDRDPELARRAAAGELAFGTIDSWLLYKLTGGAVHATEPTNASRTLLYDIHRRRWDDELLELFGVPAAMLPEVLPSSGVFGRTATLSGIPADVPIAGMAGDQQAALYGQGCWRPGMAKNTYGTGCFLLMNLGDQPVASEHGLLTTLCCDARGDAVYGLEGSVFVAGAAIQWLRDGLGLLRDASESEAMAGRLEDNGGVYLVPAFAGLGAPYWDMDARGTIVGLTRGSGRDHLVRAALESIAYQTRDVVDAMNADATTGNATTGDATATGGRPIVELRVDGGACANDFLLQFQADLLGLPVDRPANIETTAAGSAFLAGLAVGFWSDPEELASARRSERRFEPAMERAEADALYRGWKQAVARATSKPMDLAAETIS